MAMKKNTGIKTIAVQTRATALGARGRSGGVAAGCHQLSPSHPLALNSAWLAAPLIVATLLAWLARPAVEALILRSCRTFGRVRSVDGCPEEALCPGPSWVGGSRVGAAGGGVPCDATAPGDYTISARVATGTGYPDQRLPGLARTALTAARLRADADDHEAV